MAKFGEQGYGRGAGRSFTPSVDAEWVDDFNELLEQYNSDGVKYSRNKLTEKLISDGLKYNNAHHSQKDIVNVSFSKKEFSEKQLEILQNEVGLNILKNLLKAALSEDGYKFGQVIVVNEEEKTEISTADSKIEDDTEEPHDDEVDGTVEEKAEDDDFVDLDEALNVHSSIRAD